MAFLVVGLSTFNIFSASLLLLAELISLEVTLRVRLMKEALSAASHVPAISTQVDKACGWNY